MLGWLFLWLTAAPQARQTLVFEPALDDPIAELKRILARREAARQGTPPARTPVPKT